MRYTSKSGEGETVQDALEAIGLEDGDVPEQGIVIKVKRALIPRFGDQPEYVGYVAEAKL